MESIVKWDRSRRLAPDQWTRRKAAGKQPRCLARSVPVVPLLDTARPAADPVGVDPAAILGRDVQVEGAPCVAALGVLQYPTPSADGHERRREASVVVAQHEARPGCRRTAPIPAPALARRMRHDRERAGIESRIARAVPWVNVRQTEVAASGFNEKRGDHDGHDAAPALAMMARESLIVPPKSR